MKFDWISSVDPWHEHGKQDVECEKKPHERETADQFDYFIRNIDFLADNIDVLRSHLVTTKQRASFACNSTFVAAWLNKQSTIFYDTSREASILCQDDT